MHAGLFDVFHDAADQDIFAVTHGIDIHFHGIAQEVVQQHRRIVGHAHGLAHVARQVFLGINNLHGAAAQHIGWTHHQRVADVIRQLQRFFRIGRRAVRRLLQPQTLDHLLETLPVLGMVDGIGRGTDHGDTIGFQAAREFQRRLAAILHDDTLRLLDTYDLEHVLQRQRLEVQPVGGIVIR